MPAEAISKRVGLIIVEPAQPAHCIYLMHKIIIVILDIHGVKKLGLLTNNWL